MLKNGNLPRSGVGSINNSNKEFILHGTSQNLITMSPVIAVKSQRDYSHDYLSTENKPFGSNYQAQAANSFRDLLKNAQMQNFSKPMMINDKFVLSNQSLIITGRN